MHAVREVKGKVVCLLIALLLVVSSASSTATKAVGPSELQSTARGTQSMLSAGTDHYTDEGLTGCIEAWPDNKTSSGIESTSNIIGNADGLLMEMAFVSVFEFALFKINGSIMSDSLTLKGFVDGGGTDTFLKVFTWVDPYTAPNLDGVTQEEISDDWFELGANLMEAGDIVIGYMNMSIEYLLLVGHSSGTGPGYYQLIDAIEVRGFTNVMADVQNDGLPDIWQYEDVEMHNISAEIGLFGYTFGIMGLTGVASAGSTNLEFLTPFIKLGVIDSAEVDETHYYIICQAELTLPFAYVLPYLQFLGSHDLVNMTFIEANETIYTETGKAFARYIGLDNRIRTYHVIDYTVDGTFDPQNYFAAQGQINAEYTTLDVKTSTPKTAQEEFDLDVSIVLDIVENVMDAVQGGTDMVTQFLSKIIGFVQGKMMDGIGKELMEKITKKALKTALKAVLSITTIKDIIVKGSKILEKLGVDLPDWLVTARDFIESIPFIDPPVEIWKVRLTFEDESTGVPVLGYDYTNNVSIYEHPKGIYFGDTYSAQVILSSRDIFPVVERIQSVNGSRTLTGNLYVEDLGTLEADMARSSLEPGEAAEGRVYALSPEDPLVISQCHITAASSPPATVELGTAFNVSLSVSDENGTLLSDESKARAAINNMPGPMVEIPLVAEADGTLTLSVNTGTLSVALGDHMIAAIYKQVAMFHDYWNFTFVLQDTLAPTISDLSAVLSSDQSTIVFGAIVSDYDLSTSSVVLKTIDGSTNLALATSHVMTYNGSHFVASVAVSSFDAATVYFRVEAADNTGNEAQSTLQSVDMTTPSELGPLGIFIAAGVGAVVLVGVVVYVIRRPGR